MEPSPLSPAEASDSTDPADWTIGFAGAGPLTIGGNLDTEKAALTAYTPGDATLCPNPNMRVFTSKTNPTVWVEVGSADRTTIVSASIGGDMAGARASGSPTTEAGVGIGSTEAEVIAAYPDATKTEDPDVRYTVNDNSDTRLDFILFDEQVVTISVLGASAERISEFCG